MSSTTSPPERAQPPIIMGSLGVGVMLMEYRIEHVLGKPGGFGITYLATDTNLEKKVAIKEYLPTDFAMRNEGMSISVRSTDDREAFEWGMKSFLNEARTLARYKHPNVVQVHRLFEANHTAYIVMEYVEGDTLSETLRKKSGVSEIELKQILLPIADGLDTVHKSGVLHRDIKPHNIILRRDGTPVLIDFGAARNSLGSKTRSIISVLTAGYAPIEQYSEVGDQGPWTDIYALAAVAYSAITGKTPPDAINRLSNDPMKPAVVVGDGRFSRPFLEALDWGLRMKREERPQTLAEWRAALVGQRPVPHTEAAPADMVIDEVDFDLTAPSYVAETPAPVPQPAPPAAPARPPLDLMQTIVKPLDSLMATQDASVGQPASGAPPPAAEPPAFDKTGYMPAHAFTPPAAPTPARAAEPLPDRTVMGSAAAFAARPPPAKAVDEDDVTVLRPRSAAPAAAPAGVADGDDATVLRPRVRPTDDDATVLRPRGAAAAVAPTPMASTPVTAAPQPPPAGASARKWLPLAAAGVVLLIIGILAWVIWGSGSPSRTSVPVASATTDGAGTTNPPTDAAPVAPAAAPPSEPDAAVATAPASTPPPAAATPAPAPAPVSPPPSNPSSSISTIPENGGVPPVAEVAPPKATAAPKPAKVPDAKPAKVAPEPKPVNDLAPKMFAAVQGSWSARVKQPSVALDGGCSVAAYRTWKLEISSLSGDQGRITGRYTVDVNGRANSGCSAEEFNVNTSGSFVGKPLTSNQLQLQLTGGSCNGDCAAAGKLLARGTAASNAQLVTIGEKVISISIIDNGLNYVFTNH